MSWSVVVAANPSPGRQAINAYRVPERLNRGLLLAVAQHPSATGMIGKRRAKNT